MIKFLPTIPEPGSLYPKPAAAPFARNIGCQAEKCVLPPHSRPAKKELHLQNMRLQIRAESRHCPRPIRGPKRLTAKSVSHKVMVSQSCLWFQHCSPLRD